MVCDFSDLRLLLVGDSIWGSGVFDEFRGGSWDSGYAFFERVPTVLWFEDDDNLLRRPPFPFSLFCVNFWSLSKK